MCSGYSIYVFEATSAQPERMSSQRRKLQTDETRMTKSSLTVRIPQLLTFDKFSIGRTALLPPECIFLIRWQIAYLRARTHARTHAHRRGTPKKHRSMVYGITPGSEMKLSQTLQWDYTGSGVIVCLQCLHVGTCTVHAF